jgi:mono/diheme cytochrome c family protein
MRRMTLVLLAIGLCPIFLSLGAAAAALQDAHFADVPAKDHARVNPLADKPDAISAGASLYKAHCAECHQADARGDGAKKPSLCNPQVRSATDGDLEWFLRQGDLRHGMPSWSSLTQAQRWALVTYLRSLE